MITVIWIALIVVNLFFGLCFRKNNKIVVLISVILIVMLLGGNNYNADFPGYYRYYNSQIYPSSMERGYVFLSSLSHAAGLTYQSFVIILMIISIAITSVVLIRYKTNCHLVMVFYLTTLFFLDAVQIRQMLAYSLFTLSMMFMADRKKINAGASLIIATLFQWTAIVFFPLLFLDPRKRLSKKAIRIIVAIIFALCAFVFIRGNSLSFLMPVFRAIVNADKLVYFDTKTRFGFVLYFAFQFACMYISYLCKNNIDKFSDNENLKYFADYTFIATMYACIAMPLVMVNNNFSRLFKYSMMSCFILLSTIIKGRQASKEKIRLSADIVGTPSTLGAVLIVYIAVYELVIQLDSVVFDVLNNNIYF